MTIKEALKKYHQIEIELLLAHVLKKPKEFLYINPEHRLTRIQIDRLTRMVKRRMGGEPIAYILGHKDFYGMRFKVNKDVLIPRPETEGLVEKALSSLASFRVSASERGILPLRSFGCTRDDAKLIKILDLATGSGCIIVSLAKILSQGLRIKGEGFAFFASDISAKALKIAKQNAKNLLVKYCNTGKYGSILSKVKFIQSDLFEKVKGEFDIIVANLPYVPAADYQRLLKNLKYEPKEALTDGTNKWILYQKFLEQAWGHLKPNGIILLEIDPKSKMLLAAMQKKYLPKGDIKFFRDFNGFWRYAAIGA